jgi:hypothetical protein
MCGEKHVKDWYVGCEKYTRLLISLVERTTASDLLFCSDSILSYTNVETIFANANQKHFSTHISKPSFLGAQIGVNTQDASLKPSPNRFHQEAESSVMLNRLTTAKMLPHKPIPRWLSPK